MPYKMSYKPFRVLLDLTELNIECYKYVWINVSPRELKTIGDFKSSLFKKLNFKNRDIKLFVREGLLLDDENIIILREDDTVKVQYEEKCYTVFNETNGWEREKLQKSVLKEERSHENLKSKKSKRIREESVGDASTHKIKKRRNDNDLFLDAGVSELSFEITEDQNISDLSDPKTKKQRKKNNMLLEDDVSKLSSEINRDQNVSEVSDTRKKKHRKNNDFDDLGNSFPKLKSKTSKNYKTEKHKQSHSKDFVQENKVNPLVELGSTSMNIICTETTATPILEDFQKDINSSSIQNVDTDDVPNSVSDTTQPKLFEIVAETLPSGEIVSAVKRKRKRKKHKKRKDTSNVPGTDVPNLENPSMVTNFMPENCSEINNSLGVRKHIRYTSPSNGHNNNTKEISAISSESFMADNKPKDYAETAATLTKKKFHKFFDSSTDVPNTSPKISTPTFSNEFNYDRCDMTPVWNATSCEVANVCKFLTDCMWREISRRKVGLLIHSCQNLGKVENDWCAHNWCIVSQDFLKSCLPVIIVKEWFPNGIINRLQLENWDKSKENKDERVLQDDAMEGKDKYAEYPILESMPAVGTRIAYKILELDSSYSPEVSDYKEGIIKSIDADTDEIEVALSKVEVKPAKTGKFENLHEGEVPSPEIITHVILSWPTLIEPRLVIK